MIKVTPDLEFNNNHNNYSYLLTNTQRKQYLDIILKNIFIYCLFLKTVGNYKYPFHSYSYFFRSAKKIGLTTGYCFAIEKTKDRLNFYSLAFCNFTLEVLDGLQIVLAKSHVSLLSKTGSQSQNVFLTRFNRLLNTCTNTSNNCLQSSVLRRLKRRLLTVKIHQLPYFNFTITLLFPKCIQAKLVTFFSRQSIKNHADEMAINTFEIVDMDFNNFTKLTTQN